MNKEIKYNYGFSLVEMLIYIAILTLFMVVITQGLTAFLTSYRVVKSIRSIESSLIIAGDRIEREIRNSNSASVSTIVTVSDSLTLVNDAGPLCFTRSTDGILKLYRSSCSSLSNYMGPLTMPTTNLRFYLISTSTKQAIRTEMTIQATVNGVVKSKNLYNTASVRGAY
ncbi:MAG: prepilin-type N-terminal cleavage/methylation domain-containing protein [Candidatus Paceibacterota bacterium]